jgi:hypothetical protein
MSAKFLEGFGNKLAEQWVATILTPAFVFWAGGCIAAIQEYGWIAASKWFTPLPEVLQIASLFGILLAISLSAFIIQRLDRSVVRILEGYWHPLFKWLKNYLIKSHIKHRKNLEEQFNKINPPRNEDRSKFIQIDSQLQRYPSNDRDILPTRLGNILRAAERRPLDRYGLDAIIVWTRLWTLLPDGTRADLQAARSDLNTAARIWLWSILFLIWFPVFGIGAWWVIPIGLISAWYTHYVWLPEAASSYADLIDAAFDLHRTTLYKSLRWKLPENASEEVAFGTKITEYLWRGSISDTTKFQPPS